MLTIGVGYQFDVQVVRGQCRMLCVSRRCIFPSKECTALDILKSCAWASRGWTLQELIAADTVIFLTNRWQSLGVKTRVSRLPDVRHGTVEHRAFLVQNNRGGRPHHTRCDVFEPGQILEALVCRTRIPAEVLRRKETLSRQSVAAKMSWMSDRLTTRVEDQAYCLLGLFSINMPMLYGEGDKAFGRLQEEILRQSSDESIFAWNTRSSTQRLLAHSPKLFAGYGDVRRTAHYDRIPYYMTNQGLRFEFYSGMGVHEMERGLLVVLNCCARRFEGESDCVLLLERAACGHYKRRHLPYSPHDLLPSGELDNISYTSEPELKRRSRWAEIHNRHESRRKPSTRVIYVHVGEQHHTACDALHDDPDFEVFQNISD